MHLGIVCPELMGHLNPSMSLGRELARRGHRVSVVASNRVAATIRAGGLEHVQLPGPEELGWDEQHEWRRVGERQGIRAFLRTLKVFRKLARDFQTHAPERLRAAGIEGLLVDQFSPGGALVADELRLPFVVTCGALASQCDADSPPPTMAWRYRPTWFGRRRNWLGYTAGRVASDAIWLRRKPRLITPLMLVNDPESWGLAIIAQQPESFDFPHASLPNHFHYTGPWHDAARGDGDAGFPWEWLDGRPLVYASLGTLQNRLRHVYEAIARSAVDLDVQVVLALGNRDARLDFTPPPNVLVAPYAPQLKLLQRATVAITHAGLNTALECLSLGVPMVCIPVTNDQPGVARRVEWLRAGTYVGLRGITVRRIRDSLLEVLNEPLYRNAARLLQAKIGRLNGLARAADIVEEAFATGRRVRRT